MCPPDVCPYELPVLPPRLPRCWVCPLRAHSLGTTPTATRSAAAATADRGDDLWPPLRVVLEVDSTGCTSADGRGQLPAGVEGERAGHGRSRRSSRPRIDSHARPACRRTSGSGSSCAATTTATCSVSPTTASARSAADPDPRQLVVDQRGRAVAGPGDLVPGDDLEAHLGRPPLLVVEPGDHRVGGGVVPHVEQPPGTPGAQPVVLPDGAVAHRLTLRPVVAGQPRQRVEVVVPRRPQQQRHADLG